MDPELEFEGEDTPYYCPTSLEVDVEIDTANEPDEHGTQEAKDDTIPCETYSVPCNSQSGSTHISSPIVKLCANILSRFDTKVQPDDFIQKEIQKFEPMYGEYELYYLVELFFGVLDRINCIINVIITFRNSSLSEGLTWTEADTCELEVLSYIIFFAAKDVSPKSLHEVFVSYSWKGAKQFYRFIVSSACMDSSMMLGVLDVYAVDYVEAIIFSNVRCALTTLKAAFCSRPNDGEEKQKLPRNTVVEPFSFGEVKPRPPPPPEVKPPPFRASKVPYTTHHSPRPSRRLEAEYEKNRMRGCKNIVTLVGLERKSRIYHEEDKSCNFYRKLTSIKVERRDDLERSKFMPSRIPLDEVLKGPKVKPGTTYSDILRQKQLCFNEKQAELHALNNLPLVKTFDVQERDLKLHREEEEQQAMMLQKKKIEAKLTFQKAIAARRQIQDVKRGQVDEYKEQINRMLEGKLREDQLEELQMLRMKVKALDEQELQQQQAALKAAKEKTAKERKYRKEKMEKLKSRDAGKSEERRKRDLVQKIRASRIKPKLDIQHRLSNFSACTETQLYLIETFMRNRWMKLESHRELEAIKYKKYCANKEAGNRKELMKADIDECRRRRAEKKQLIEKEKSLYQTTQYEQSSPALTALKTELEALTLENLWARGKYY